MLSQGKFRVLLCLTKEESNNEDIWFSGTQEEGQPIFTDMDNNSVRDVSKILNFGVNLYMNLKLPT